MSDRTAVPAGAIPLKRWLMEEAERCGVTASAISRRLYRGKYPQLSYIRINARVVYVLSQPTSDHA